MRERQSVFVDSGVDRPGLTRTRFMRGPARRGETLGAVPAFTLPFRS
jgi:hypothetical protein